MRKIWMLVCVLALGCSLALETPVDIELAKPFTLEPGRGGAYLARYQPANWNLEFVRVVQDSRCPKGVECFWAGDGELEFRAYRDREQKLFRLHTGLEPRAVVVLGYRLKLTQLDPERESNVTPAYRATLMLENP
jgi:hypothetical protein